MPSESSAPRHLRSVSIEDHPLFKSGEAGGKLGTMLRQEAVASVCAMMLMFGGCPKRQERQSVVIYVPSPPVTAAATTAVKTGPEKPEVLVIEEPAPPAETPPVPEKPPVPQGQGTVGSRHHRPAGRTATPAETDDTAPPETPETPPPEVPVLEPRESTAQEAQLRQQYEKLAQDVRQRLERLNAGQLSDSDQRTLADARTFLAQSANASRNGDLPRALKLAQKASLLAAALE